MWPNSQWVNRKIIHQVACEREISDGGINAGCFLNGKCTSSIIWEFPVRKKQTKQQNNPNSTIPKNNFFITWKWLAKKGNHVLGCIMRSVTRKLKKVLSSAEIPSGVLHLHLGPTTQEGLGCVGAGLKESHKDRQRTEAHLLSRQTGRVGQEKRREEKRRLQGELTELPSA